jgi:hypothetical protein
LASSGRDSQLRAPLALTRELERKLSEEFRQISHQTNNPHSMLQLLITFHRKGL